MVSRGSVFAFFIGFLLRGRCFAATNEADHQRVFGCFALSVNDEQNFVGSRCANADVAVFRLRVFFIGEGDQEGVIEDRFGLLKTDLVLFEVFSGLVFVPLKRSSILSARRP